MRNVLIIPLAAAGLIVAAPAAAQEQGSRQTRDFVQAASQSDQFEILEAQTALSESKDPGIQAFARRMITDHQRSSDTLKAAATRSGLKPPPPSPGIASGQSMFLAALQSLRGEEFDKAYARQQVLAHHAALAIEQVYAASGDDPNLRQVASATVPMIQSHTDMAERLSTRLGGS